MNVRYNINNYLECIVDHRNLWGSQGCLKDCVYKRRLCIQKKMFESVFLAFHFVSKHLVTLMIIKAYQRRNV